VEPSREIRGVGAQLAFAYGFNPAAIAGFNGSFQRRSHVTHCRAGGVHGVRGRGLPARFRRSTLRTTHEWDYLHFGAGPERRVIFDLRLVGSSVIWTYAVVLGCANVS
jgi:hypothetical protein